MKLKTPTQQRWTCRLGLFLVVILFQGRLSGDNIKLAWDPPTTTTNVASYVIHVGTSSRQYQTSTNVGLSTSITLKGFVPGNRYYLAASSINKQGRQSSFSNELIVDLAELDRLPTIAGLSDVVIEKNGSSGPIPFQLVNGIGASSDWLVEAISSDPALIPSQNISVEGTSTNRTIQFSTEADRLGSAVITVFVTDGTRTNTHALNVTVTAANLAPIVDAGLGTTVRTNLSFMLRGRATDDGLPPVPGHLVIQWSKLSGPGVVTFGNPNFALTTVRFSGPGLYRLRLTAFDGELTSTSEIVIRAQLVSDLTPPSISNLTVTDVTQTTVSLTWNTDELSDDQVRYAAEDGVPKFTLLNQTPKLFHAVTVTNLEPGATYTLAARSRDSGANQTFSDPLVVQTLQEALLISEVGASPSNTVTPKGYAYDRDDLATDGSETTSFEFYAPITDTYFVWARMVAPSDIYQPFSVSMNLGSRDSFDPPEGSWSSTAQWVLLNGRNDSAPLTLSPRTFNLTGGHQSVFFSGREAQSAVTKILVTNKPEFVPVDGDDCCPTGTEVQLPQISVAVRSGWSMIACPLEAEFPYVASLLPNPPLGTTFFKYDSALGTYLQNRYDGVAWEVPDMPMAVGEGGLLYNPGESFTWSLRGTLGSSPESVASQLHVGLNFLALSNPKAGLLTKVLAGLQFKAGDAVQRMTADNGTYQTYAFDGQNWDIIPVINVGEAIFVTLVER